MELKFYTFKLGTVLYYAGCNFTHATIRLVSQDKLGKSVFSKDEAGHEENGLHRMGGIRSKR